MTHVSGISVWLYPLAHWWLLSHAFQTHCLIFYIHALYMHYFIHGIMYLSLMFITLIGSSVQLISLFVPVICFTSYWCLKIHVWYSYYSIGGFMFITSLSALGSWLPYALFNSIMALYSCLAYPLCYRWYIVHIPHVYHLIISSVKLIDSSKLMLSAIPFTLYLWLQVHFWYWQPHWWLHVHDFHIH